MNSKIHLLLLIFIPMAFISVSGCIGQDESQLTYEYSFQLEGDEFKIIFFEDDYCNATYLSNGKESKYHLKYERKIFGGTPNDPDFKKIMEDHQFILPSDMRGYLGWEYIKIDYFDRVYIFVDSEKMDTLKGPEHFILEAYNFNNTFIGGIPSESCVVNNPYPKNTHTNFDDDELYFHVFIESVHYDARGNDNYNKNDEYVIITNVGKSPVNMARCYIEDDKHNRYTFGSIVLAAGDSLKLCSGSGQDTDKVLYWGSEYAIWNNDGDTAILYRKDGVIISQYEIR